MEDTSPICDVRFLLAKVVPGDATPERSRPSSFSCSPYDSNDNFPTIHNYPGVPESLNTATKWLNNCIRNHPRCCINDTEPWAPTRILDLGPLGKPLHLRLCETSGSRLAQGERYLTLSHRWGTEENLKLTNANKRGLTGNIPMSALSATYLNAIQITRAIGVRYLWIDSLCIVQDSVDDWRHESMMMGEIYKRALFNIAAIGSVDQSPGFLFEKDASQLLPHRFKDAYHQYVVIRTHFWDKEIDSAPLNCRAWVLQERVLAPRVLYFHQKRLFWECRQMRRCEGFPEGSSSVLWSSTNLKRLVPNFQPHQYGDDCSVMQWQFWGEVVTAYSKCFMTQPGDKLLALSGIATEMKQLLHYRYLAGLWEELLPYELLWKASQRSIADGRHSRTVENYVAPSWSWASVEGPISYPEELWDVYQTLNRQGECSYLLEAHVSHVDQNETGQVDGGFLRLWGKVGTMTWTWSSEGPTSAIPQALTISSISPVPESWSEPSQQNQRAIRHWYIEVDKPVIESQSYIWVDDISDRSSPVVAFCFPIYVQSSHVLHSMDGLLLTQLSSGEFQRIGVFSLDDDRIDEMMELLEAQEVKII